MAWQVEEQLSHTQIVFLACQMIEELPTEARDKLKNAIKHRVNMKRRQAWEREQTAKKDQPPERPPALPESFIIPDSYRA